MKLAEIKITKAVLFIPEVELMKYLPAEMVKGGATGVGRQSNGANRGPGERKGSLCNSCANTCKQAKGVVVSCPKYREQKRTRLGG